METNRHKWVTGLLLSGVLVVIAILWKGLNLNPNAAPMALQDKPANSFTVSLLQGKEHLRTSAGDAISLADFAGRPLILNFWASWCVSCREEARLVEQYWKKYGPKGIQIVGIAVNDKPSSALEFAKYFGKTYVLGLDESGKAGIDYGVTGVPETFFIDPKGKIRHKEAGPLSPELLEKWIAVISKAGE